jgi:hypothetical protein
MNEKPFGNFGTWSLKELIDKERSFPVGDRRGAELQAEINRRLAAESKRTASINRFVVLFTAIAAIVSIVYALDRGIFLGSDTSLVNLKRRSRYTQNLSLSVHHARASAAREGGALTVRPRSPAPSRAFRNQISSLVKSRVCPITTRMMRLSD